MAYHFRPSKPKAAVHSKRPTKRESVFQVERGPISNQKRDIKQLDEFRSRSYLQRGCNKFQTASQRSGLTVGEQEIEKRSCKTTDSPGPVNQKLCSIQTLPYVEKDFLAAKFIPRCFEYVQNYHHYVLDLNKLEKGGHVPYLTHTDKKNTSSKSGRKSTKEEEDIPQGCSKPRSSNYFAGLPKRTPKSASRSRRGSASNMTTSDFDVLVNHPSATNSPRDEQDRGMDGDYDRKENESNTLQDLIISEIEDEMERKESTADLTCLQGDSIYQVPNPSTTDLRAPSGTPVATPRSSSVHHAFPNLPNSWSSDVKSSGISQGVSSVSSEVRKPHLAAFTTRIPPLKAPDVCPNEDRRKHRNTCMPDYQRYRILCDAFRPMFPLGGRGRRHIDRHRPNFVTSEELDYYIDVVNNINAVNAYYSY